MGALDNAYVQKNPQSYWRDVASLRLDWLRYDVRWDKIAATQYRAGPRNTRELRWAVAPGDVFNILDGRSSTEWATESEEPWVVARIDAGIRALKITPSRRGTSPTIRFSRNAEVWTAPRQAALSTRIPVPRGSRYVLIEYPEGPAGIRNLRLFTDSDR